MEKLRITLNLYLSLSLIPSILQVIFFVPVNPLCLQYGPRTTDILPWILCATFMLVNALIITTITCLLFCSLQAAIQTREISGRAESHQDISFQKHIRTCIAAAHMYGPILLVLVVLSAVDQFLPDMIEQIFSLFILPLPSIVNPFIYTLTCNCLK